MKLLKFLGNSRNSEVASIVGSYDECIAVMILVDLLGVVFGVALDNQVLCGFQALNMSPDKFAVAKTSKNHENSC